MYDFIIIGGGIVGASTAWQLKQQYPHKRILLIEKEKEVATHQTGRNSGVIHAGVYYEPGSLKAKFCKEGLKNTIEFCRKHSIPVKQCGKLLVATNQQEYQRMKNLFNRCVENGVQVTLLDQKALKQCEPNISGIGAIQVAATGIVDYSQITHKMIDLFTSLGGEYHLNQEVVSLVETRVDITVNTKNEMYRTRYLISCAGLMADRISKMLGIDHGFKIIPFRGEYYQLPDEMSGVIRHLIYPIPDPAMPFLGVHLTRMINGTITVGPNAVLGWKREGYKTLNVSFRDVWDMLSFPGFWRVIANNLNSGLKELKNSLWKLGYLKQVRKFYPKIEMSDLRPYPVGIRAQAVLNDGTLVHDFLFSESARSLHVCNAPSPAATSAIPIGKYICDKIDTKFAPSPD